MITRRNSLVAAAALLAGCARLQEEQLMRHMASVSASHDETFVLDGWTVIMTRAERLRDIIKASYLHRDQDRELMNRVRTHMEEINGYLDRIEAKIK